MYEKSPFLGSFASTLFTLETCPSFYLDLDGLGCCFDNEIRVALVVEGSLFRRYIMCRDVVPMWDTSGLCECQHDMW